jgi:aspartate racemase
MKTIGLIGGTSWVSTAEYYRIINEESNKALGGMEFAQIILYSVNYGEIIQLGAAGDFDTIARKISSKASALQQSGANCLLLCANTMHSIADRVQEVLNVPLIHIAEVTADAIKKKNIHKVGLLGTKITMEMDFYKDKLAAAGIGTVIPEKGERDYIHETIHTELCKNILKPETKAHYLQIISDLKAQGAQGIILGCTEIPLLIQQPDVDIPVFDTTYIHAKAAVDFALADQ